MTDLLYADRVRHFNDERQLCAKYLKMITPDAHTMHYTSLEAKSFADGAKMIQEECLLLREREAQLSSQFDEKTAQIYEARAMEGERAEKIEWLSSLPALTEVEPDTTYYYKDHFHKSILPQASKVSASKPLKAKVTLRRIISGKESKLEKELAREVRELNDVKQAILKYLDSVDHKAAYHTSLLNHTVVGLKTKAHELVAEVERLDLQSYNTTMELLNLRLRVMTIQREEAEDADKLQRELVAYADRETSIHMELNNEVTELNMAYEGAILSSLKEFQSQLHSFNSKEAQLLQQDKALLDPRETTELLELRREEAAAKARYERLHTRSHLEMEGFNSESLALRQRLAKVEKLCSAKK